MERVLVMIPYERTTQFIKKTSLLMQIRDSSVRDFIVSEKFSL